MAPDDQVNQSGTHTPSQIGRPAPLSNNARATIYLDGLIYAAYNEPRRVLESAICTDAEHHHLEITVKLRNSGELLFPTDKKPWNTDRAIVKQSAPFWLYVDSGNGIKEEEFAAELHTGDRTFESVFDFEGHHRQALPLKADAFAVFNFPHGEFYSADTKQARLQLIPPDTGATVVEKGEIPVSNLAGIDINAVSNGAQKKWIVLANQNGQNEFFRFELEPEKQYEISVEMRPDGTDPNPHDPHHHFLQFYELFDVDQTTLSKFLVVPPEQHVHPPDPEPAREGGEPRVSPPSPDNPPCAPGRGSGTGGLSGGGG